MNVGLAYTSSMQKIVTIRLAPATVERIRAQRIVERETYDEVIRRALACLEASKDETTNARS